MAEKRVKIGKEFEYVPAVKSGNGWLGLEKGKFGKVRFEKRFGKLELWIRQGDTWKRSLFAVEDYAKANAAAREANKIGEQAGSGFGTLRKEEEAALKRWRAYVLAKEQAGAPARNLDELLREAIEREETKDETPLFVDAAFQFIEAKERAGACSLAYRRRISTYLKNLSRELEGKRLSEIGDAVLNEAISAVARPRSGTVPSAKTRKHYIDITKEFFKWWYVRENSTRRPADKLNNPLEIVSAPKIIKTRDPDILTPAQTRAVLAELWADAPEAVPAAVLQLFCGVREAEALRLRWRDIIDGELRLSCTITKTKLARAVPVPANAAAWIEACRVRGLQTPPEGLIFPFNDVLAAKLFELSPEARERVETEQFNCRARAYSYRIKRACRRAGLTETQNAFRHTAASCLAVIHGQFRAADYCGHSVRTQGTNYRNPVSAVQAKDYFGIMPPVSDGKAIAFSREGRKGRSRDEAGAESLSSSEHEETGGRGEAEAI